MHLCAELIAASMMLEPLGEDGANFSLQLSSRTQFTKINNKKVIAENQCEKHKKSSLNIALVLQDKCSGKNCSSFLDFTRNYEWTSGTFVPWFAYNKIRFSCIEDNIKV